MQAIPIESCTLSTLSTAQQIPKKEPKSLQFITKKLDIIPTFPLAIQQPSKELNKGLKQKKNEK
jgi:hypothetical protein